MFKGVSCKRYNDRFLTSDYLECHASVNWENYYTEYVHFRIVIENKTNRTHKLKQIFCIETDKTPCFINSFIIEVDIRVVLWNLGGTTAKWRNKKL